MVERGLATDGHPTAWCYRRCQLPKMVTMMLQKPQGALAIGQKKPTGIQKHNPCVPVARRRLLFILPIHQEVPGDGEGTGRRRILKGKKALSPIQHSHAASASSGEAWVEASGEPSTAQATSAIGQHRSGTENEPKDVHTLPAHLDKKQRKKRPAMRRTDYSPVRRKEPGKPHLSRLANDSRESESEKSQEAELRDHGGVQSVESLSLEDLDAQPRRQGSHSEEGEGIRNKLAAQASAAVAFATEAAQNATHVANVNREKLMQRREARLALEQQGHLSPSPPVAEKRRNVRPYEQKRALIQQEVNRRSRSSSPYTSKQGATLPKTERTGLAKSKQSESTELKRGSLERRIGEIQEVYQGLRKDDSSSQSARFLSVEKRNGVPRKPRVVSYDDTSLNERLHSYAISESENQDEEHVTPSPIQWEQNEESSGNSFGDSTSDNQTAYRNGPIARTGEGTIGAHAKETANQSVPATTLADHTNGTAPADTIPGSRGLV
eukprot:gb/GECG01002441.1/.p1 GENE.gb/GECG01002441.1/~~gb/GECG01002441.1/.p1  ORF type:complete len:494 (+),score=61.96 gb/GECG01002441.1/:1-1482(+)